MRSSTWDEVRARRLHRQFLSRPVRPARIVEVVRGVGGIHAQVMSSAELSLAARIAGLNATQVREALWDRRSLVKTWSLRGTLHIHPADELPLWMAARRAITGWDDGSWKRHDIERAQAEEILAAIGDVLDGRSLLREELAAAVTQRVGEWAREGLMSGWGQWLGPATSMGLLCHGPPRGTKVTFVRADQWIGGWQDIAPAEALREVCRRFIAAYGPVTHHQFSMWVIARKPAHARAVFESLADELLEVEVEGKRAFLLARDATFPRATEVPARLLPQYDCYVAGFREREHLLSDAARAYAKAHPKGKLEGPVAVPWLLVDGRVAGTWTRARAGKRLEITLEPFERLTKAQRAAVDDEVARVRAFLSGDDDASRG